MTHPIGQIILLDVGRLCRMATAVALLALGACTTANFEDVAPSSADLAAQGNVQGPTDTGSFPNLNIVPRQAAPQLTDAEKNAKLAELNADKAAAVAGASGAPAPDDSAELRSLAKNHAEDTLKQIEGKCDPALDPTCN